MARKKVEKLEKSFITYKGEDYELVFNLNVMEDIQEQYGSVEAWGELVEASAEPKAKDIKYGFTAMLNEGIDIDNEERDEKKPYLSHKAVGRILTEVGLNSVTDTMNGLVIESTKTDDGKNE